MSSQATLRFVSQSSDGRYRIGWYSHALTGDLAAHPDGITLALEPRLYAHADAPRLPLEIQSPAELAWNNGHAPKPRQLVSIEPKGTTRTEHQFEVTSLSRRWIVVDCATVMSDGNWTPLFQKKGWSRVAFEIGRAPFGVRLIISTSPDTSTERALEALMQVTEKDAKPQLVAIDVDRAISRTLRTKFSVLASVTDSPLAPNLWEGGTAALLSQLASEMHGGADPRGRLADAYWKSVGLVLGYGTNLKEPNFRNGLTGSISADTFEGDFSPFERLHKMASDGAAALCWVTDSGGQTRPNLWHGINSRALAFSRAMGANDFRILPDPLPDSGGNVHWLKEKLLMASAASHLADFHATSDSVASLEELGRAARKLLENADELSRLISLAREERVLQREVAALRAELNFEAVSDKASLAQLLAKGTVQEQIQILQQHLAPVNAIRAAITELGYRVEVGEQAKQAADRVAAAVAAELEAQRISTENKVEQLSSFPATDAGAPPVFSGQRDPRIDISFAHRGTVWDQCELLQNLIVQKAHEQLLSNWCERQRYGLQKLSEDTAVRCFDRYEHRALFLSAITKTISELEADSFRDLLDIAPKYGTLQRKYRREIEEQQEILRLAHALPSEVAPASVWEQQAIERVRLLGSRLKEWPRDLSQWRECEEVFAQANDLFAASTWYHGRRKLDLVLAWRCRVARACYELSSNNLSLDASDIDRIWREGGRATKLLDAGSHATLLRHGLLRSQDHHSE